MNVTVGVAAIAAITNLVSLVASSLVVYGLVLDRRRRRPYLLPRVVVLWAMTLMLVIDVLSALRGVVDNLVVFGLDHSSHDSGTDACFIFGWLNLMLTSAHATIGTLFWAVSFFAVMPRIGRFRGYTGSAAQVFWCRGIALVLLLISVVGSTVALVQGTATVVVTANVSSVVNTTYVIEQGAGHSWCYAQDPWWVWALVWVWYVLQSLLALAFAATMVPTARRIAIGNVACDVMMRRFFICVAMGVAALLIIVTSSLGNGWDASTTYGYFSAAVVPLLGLTDAITFLWSEPWFVGETLRARSRGDDSAVRSLPDGFTRCLHAVAVSKRERSGEEAPLL